MQYYVIGPDGNKYGPADVETLKQWVAENRLGAQSMLEDFGTGQRMTASQVPGLFENQAPTGTMAPGTMAPGTSPGAAPNMGAPSSNAYQPYLNPAGSRAAGDDGSGDVTVAWILGAVSLLCCGPACLIGISRANRAALKGHPGANAAKIFNIVAAVLWCCWIAYNVMKAMNHTAP